MYVGAAMLCKFPKMKVKNSSESPKMDSSINIVNKSKKIAKKHGNKKDVKANGALSKSDLIEVAEETFAPEKIDAAKASKETKPPKKKTNKKNAEENANGEVEEKECGRRTVPVISNTFESLRPHVSVETMAAIEGFGFSELTEVQQQTIPLLLAGRDVSAIAKTGSGKTLAFVIPAIERIKDLTEGTGCIILSPTRELAQQTYNVVRMISANHRNLTHGIVMGGTKIEKEKVILAQGVNVLVATPGRLLDHIKRSKGFRVNRLRVLVLDEADRILDAGFEKDVKQIMARLPIARRQTMQFSATTPSRLSNITHLCLAADYTTVNLISDTKKPVTSELLTQTYLVVPTFQRLLVLYKILTENKDKKVMVFLNTCDGVNFYKAVFNKLGLAVHGIHGRQGQMVRAELFKEFTKAESGTLLCTDIAARGWDIPAVHLIVLYDPPSDINEYIHRVGRAARRPDEAGQAVMMLREEERPLIDLLKQKRLDLSEYQGIDMYDLQFDVQDKVNELVSTETGLKDLATRAYRNFLTSYVVLNPKHIYDRKTIQPKELAKNFGLSEAPSFNYAREPLNHTEKDLLGKPKPKSHKGKKTGKENKGAKVASKKKSKKNKKNNKDADAKSDGQSEEDANEKKKQAKVRRKFFNEQRTARKLDKKEAWKAEQKNKASTEENIVSASKSNKAERQDKKQQQKPDGTPVKSGGKSKKRKQQEVVEQEQVVAPKKMKKESSNDSKQNIPGGSPTKKGKKMKPKVNKKSSVEQLNGVV